LEGNRRIAHQVHHEWPPPKDTEHGRERERSSFLSRMPGDIEGGGKGKGRKKRKNKRQRRAKIPFPEKEKKGRKKQAFMTSSILEAERGKRKGRSLREGILI